MTMGYEDEAVCCEGYGPAGTAVLVASRSLAEPLRLAVREVLARHGGRGGAANSVAYLFNTIGVLRYPASGRLTERALAAGAEDVRTLSSGELEVITDPDDLKGVRDMLERQGHVARTARVTRRASHSVHLDEAQAGQLRLLIQALRAIEGVEQVYTNGEIPE